MYSLRVDYLTDRQQREIAYHAQHAGVLREQERFSYEVLSTRSHKWWNHYWVAVNEVRKRGLCGRTALVPGCGAGFDAIVLGKLGANVHAFDISPEMLALAAERAGAEGVSIDFEPMAAEQQKYPNATFDLIFVRDLLHHCDIAGSMREFIRVAKPGATIIIDELYTHSLLPWLRECRSTLAVSQNRPASV